MENKFLYTKSFDSSRFNINYDAEELDKIYGNKNIAFVTYAQNNGISLFYDEDLHLRTLDDTHLDGLRPVGAYYVGNKDTFNEFQVDALLVAPTDHKLVPLTPALFIDRDGIINKDTSYLIEPKDFVMMDNVDKIIRHFNDLGYPVICITNQSGVARGYFDEGQVETLHNFINGELKKRGAHIDCFLTSPYFYDKGVGQYKFHSVLRKPFPGMVIKAEELYPIDLSRSIMIGDKNSDRISYTLIRSLILRGNYPVDDSNGDVFTSLGDIYLNLSV